MKEEKFERGYAHKIVKDSIHGQAGLKRVCAAAFCGLIGIYGRDYFESEILPVLIDVAAGDVEKANQRIEEQLLRAEEDAEGEAGAKVEGVELYDVDA